MLTGEQRPESGYTDVDRADNPAECVQRLDGVATQEFWRHIKLRTYTMLDLHAGDSVLDVGCGTGDDVRAMARLVGYRRAMPVFVVGGRKA